MVRRINLSRKEFFYRLARGERDFSHTSFWQFRMNHIEGMLLRHVVQEGPLHLEFACVRYLFANGLPLRGVYADQAKFSKCTFSQCDFSHGSYREAILERSKFSRCSFNSSDFSNALILDTCLDKSSFLQSDLSGVVRCRQSPPHFSKSYIPRSKTGEQSQESLLHAHIRELIAKGDLKPWKLSEWADILLEGSGFSYNGRSLEEHKALYSQDRFQRTMLLGAYSRNGESRRKK